MCTVEGVSRRSFIRGAIGLPLGVAIGTATPPVSEFVNSTTTEITGHPAGNPNPRVEAELACKDSPDPQGCIDNYQMPPREKAKTIIAAPLMEEAAFRVMPSGLLALYETLEDKDMKRCARTLLTGTDSFRFSRREAVTGVISSILFGLGHNVTVQGLDTNTIPASMTVDGFVYWGLQRKFGLLSNILAHSVHNARILL